MKKTAYLLVTAFLITFNSYSQHTDSSETSGKVAVSVKPEKEAQFSGGAEGWRLYLQRNLDASLANQYVKIPEGKTQALQTVKLRFVVDETGKVSNISVDNEMEVHPKIAREAIRVVKSGPKWVPAEDNGIKVKSQKTLSIGFLAT